MTYNTPELLHIGAAQNLVLALDPSKVDPTCQNDSVGEVSIDLELW